MILNRNDNILKLHTSAKSSLQIEIEENSKRHLSMYDSIIGTADVKGGIAV